MWPAASTHRRGGRASTASATDVRFRPKSRHSPKNRSSYERAELRMLSTCSRSRLIRRPRHHSQEYQNHNRNNERFPWPERAINSDWSSNPEQGSEQECEDKRGHGREGMVRKVTNIFHDGRFKSLGKTLIVVRAQRHTRIEGLTQRVAPLQNPQVRLAPATKRQHQKATSSEDPLASISRERALQAAPGPRFANAAVAGERMLQSKPEP